MRESCNSNRNMDRDDDRDEEDGECDAAYDSGESSSVISISRVQGRAGQGRAGRL
jgi:hypothetical protein